MTLGLILKRMRREWRSLGILLLAVCLLTGFFALGPFYVRAVTEIGLRYELDRADPKSLQIALILDDQPISPEAFNVVSQELGQLAASYRFFIRANYTPPTTEGGLQNPGLATGGYEFRYGEPVTALSPRLRRTFQPFAFADMPELFNLVEGRWPVRLPPPGVVDPTGLSDADQWARQIGNYNRGQVEIVITPTVAQKAQLELGSRWVVGTRLPDGSGAVASVIVVGIVEPKDPGDPFWEGARNFLEGGNVQLGIAETRYDFGFATIPEAYTDWLQNVTPGNSFIYQIKTNPNAIHAENIQSVKNHLAALQNRLNVYHPGASVLSGLAGILDRYSGSVSDTEGPITLLSGAILVLLLYHLVNTVSLVLEQQGTEWSSMACRGGSIPQLVVLQFVTVGVLGLAGMIAGPLISLVFMRLMAHFGPLSQALGGRSLGSTAIPALSIDLSTGAAIAAVIVLTVPAFPAARRSLLRLKQMASRPPTRPAWARYALDGVLLAVGTGFMLRLYYLVGGDFGHLLNNVFAAPRDVIHLIATHLNASGGLKDPFNLLGPALVLTGAAMLWLRFFPWVMELVARLVRGSRHLAAPLAVWNVARDPGHYAQLVLLLIGTLALGTASLGLSSTRDQGAWSLARAETGGSARVEVDPALQDAAQVRDDLDRAPGVSAAVSFLHTLGSPGPSTQGGVHIFGIDPAQGFPELARAAAPLHDIPAPPPPGLKLPDDARALTVQVYSLPPSNPEDPAVSVLLAAYLQDAIGVPYRVTLSPPDMASNTAGAGSSDLPVPTPTGEWLTFSGNLPTQARLPLSLVRIGIDSAQGNIDAFEHTLYLDRIAAQNVFGTSITLESFEDHTNHWAEATVANPYAASWSAAGSSIVQGVTLSPVTGGGPDHVPESEGPTALRLDYRMGRVGGRVREPSIVVNPPDVGRIPVVVNTPFAEQFGGHGDTRTAADAPLAVGDTKNIVLDMGSGSVEIGFQVVGIIDSFPTVTANEPLMIAPLTLIQPVINQGASALHFFAANEIWLELPDRQPSAGLKKIASAEKGVTQTTWAWDRYGEIEREPLPSAVAGMLFAGFWISLLLSLLDFAFYLVVTARQRLFTFAVLRSLGWNAGHLWQLLLFEQIALIVPALIVGSLIGLGLAYLLLPFLALEGGETLRLPWLSLAGLLLALIGSFSILMAVAAIFLRRMSVNQVLRLGEE